MHHTVACAASSMQWWLYVDCGHGILMKECPAYGCIVIYRDVIGGRKARH